MLDPPSGHQHQLLRQRLEEVGEITRRYPLKSKLETVTYSTLKVNPSFMSNPTLISTFLLTLLLLVGLLFFIRASVKDRTTEVEFLAEPTAIELYQQLQQHFLQRAYAQVTTDEAEQTVTFEGFVRPSLFLAVFLSLLAGTGLLCLVLVLSLVLPQFSAALLSLVLLSPLAGAFYWRSAARPERVQLQIKSGREPDTQDKTFISVIAHRDELIALQRSFPLKVNG